MLKKLIAPIIVTILFVLYCGGYALVVICMPWMPIGLKILFGGIAVALCGLMIAMFAERIREIRSGEEDDLDNY